MLTLHRNILEETFKYLRSCGAGRRECVVYWLGPRGAKGEVTQVIHPSHTATAGGYDVDGPWLNELWVRLGREELELRAQVHTHPGSAFHSSRDDDMAAIQIAGFCSLVIPRFALGPMSLDAAHLAWRDANGGWQKVLVPSDEIKVI